MLAPHIRPMKFLLPALFLFVLGVGNVWVGQYKEWQYKQVYDELSELQPASNINSTLGRIQSVPQTKDRHRRRQMEANERRNLYRLVAFGGKAFISLSLMLFALSAAARYLHQEEA